MATNTIAATLTRRQFVKVGGALFVGVSLAGRELFESSAQAATVTGSGRERSSALEERGAKKERMASMPTRRV